MLKIFRIALVGLVIGATLGGLLLTAQATLTDSPTSWLNFAWQPYLYDGNPVKDEEGSGDSSSGGTGVEPDYIDISSGAAKNNTGPGTEPSVLFAYYDGGTPGDEAWDDDFYGFRVRLNADPQHQTGYRSAHWHVLIDIDGDDWKEFVLDLDGSADRLYVFYNNLDQQEYDSSTDQVAQFYAASSTATGDPQAYNHTRVVIPATGGSDAKEVWLDFQIPITALKDKPEGDPSGVQQVYPSTLMRLFYSTSTSLNDPLQKDWMLAPVSFGDPLNPNVEATKTDSMFNDADGSEGYTAGDTILYTIVITNDGNLDADGVTCFDTPDSNTALVVGSVTTTQGSVTSGNSPGDTTVGVNVGTVARGGGSVTITFKVIIDLLLPPGVSQLSNQGTVSGTNIPNEPTDDPDTGTEDDATITTLQAADLRLEKTVDDSTPDVGDQVVYTITVTNDGPDGAMNVKVEDILPAGVSWVSDDGGGAYVSGTGIWTVGNLANGASATLHITVSVDVSGTIENIAQVNASDQYDPDSTPDNDVPGEDDQESATVTAQQGVALDPAEKSDSLIIDADGNGVASPGDTLLYRVRIWNEGTADATGVIFTDTPDPNTELVWGSVSTSKGTVEIGNSEDDSWVQVNVGTLLAGGPGSETVEVTFEVTIRDPLPYPTATHVYNQGLFDYDQNEGPPVPTDDPITPPDDDSTGTLLGPRGPARRGVPAFPSVYVGIAAALGVGILAYFVRRRLVDQD